MFNANPNRVIYDKHTGKIRAYLTQRQNLDAMLSNFTDVEWCEIEATRIPHRNPPLFIDLETKTLIE